MGEPFVREWWDWKKSICECRNTLSEVNMMYLRVNNVGVVYIHELQLTTRLVLV